ncbi:MAG TPA: HIT domain-containing protein [Acidimicrobiales bacterium]|nr:HIT domain-containing protein [Acidimicrobiales bacterium]
MTRTWPEDWEDRKRGVDCPSCARLGRPEHDWGIRVLEGDFADVYLNYRVLSRGYGVSVWKHGHVSELTELDDAQVAGYWVETTMVARAIESVHQPAKLNFQTLGNEVTHLHTHIVPRYLDDPEPGGPLPFDVARMVTLTSDELRSEVERVRAALSADRASG